MTMNQEMVDILAGLKTQWSVLKDDKKTKAERIFACGKICQLSETAKEVDPKFEMIDMNNTKYAEFLPTTYQSKSDVNWSDDENNALQGIGKSSSILQGLEAEAVSLTKKRIPSEREDSQKFGMIVGHYTKILADIYIAQNYS